MYALARALISDGKGQQGELWIRKFLALRPNDATAYYGLGYVLVAEEKLDEARGAFERSLALQPNQTESPFQLGIVAQKQGDGAAAMDRWINRKIGCNGEKLVAFRRTRTQVERALYCKLPLLS